MGCLKLTYEPVLKVLARTEKTGRSREVKSCAGLYKYKYNGKEFQDELGLNFYDYGWRNYMPDLGRWATPDPLLNDLTTTIDFDQENEDDDEIDMIEAFAAKMEVGGGVYNPYNLNPYGYGYNNPISYDDPDGRCPWCIGFFKGIAVEYGTQVVGNLIEGKSLKESLVQVDGKEILKAGVIDGVSGGLGGFINKGAKTVSVVNKANNTQKTAQKVNNVQKATSTTSKTTSKTTKTSSKYENITNKSKNNSKPTTPNRATDVNKKDFEKNLQKSG